MTSSDLWDQETAARYEETSAEMFAPAVLDPAVDLLADLAGLDGDGASLELAIGTGRVAVPLLRRGVPVTGIELSEPMVAQLRRRVDADALAGEHRRHGVDGAFSLVYLVWNGLGNLRTQEEQVACFANAAHHLRPGGRFVIELWVPMIRRFPPGQAGVPFAIDPHHVGFDTYDLATQQGTSHHFWPTEDGPARHGASRFRYVWPAECDLMARLAGLVPEARYADWDRSPFTGDSESHVSVWRRP